MKWFRRLENVSVFLLFFILLSRLLNIFTLVFLVGNTAKAAGPVLESLPPSSPSSEILLKSRRTANLRLRNIRITIIVDHHFNLVFLFRHLQSLRVLLNVFLVEGKRSILPITRIGLVL
ncbi:hypothetical protein PFISCL1PPCAC_25140, partial [Pristionchus fissidentatus]